MPLHVSSKHQPLGMCPPHSLSFCLASLECTRLDVCRVCGSDLNVPLLITRNSHIPPQFYDLDQKQKGLLCLSLMAISYSMLNPKSIILRAIIDPRQDAFRWWRIDSHSEGIMKLVINLNLYTKTILNSFFSIQTPASINLRVVSEMRGTR